MSEPPDYWDYPDPEGEPDDGESEDPFKNDLYDIAGEEVADFLRDIGITSQEQVIISFDEITDPSQLRGNVFSSIGEALNFLYDIGVLGFANVVRFWNEDETDEWWQVYINYPEK